jgi:hypothetical protein
MTLGALAGLVREVVVSGTVAPFFISLESWALSL